jgi:hypothetical protein
MTAFSVVAWALARRPDPGQAGALSGRGDDGRRDLQTIAACHGKTGKGSPVAQLETGPPTTQISQRNGGSTSKVFRCRRPSAGEGPRLPGHTDLGMPSAGRRPGDEEKVKERITELTEYSLDPGPEGFGRRGCGQACSGRPRCGTRTRAAPMSRGACQGFVSAKARSTARPASKYFPLTPSSSGLAASCTRAAPPFSALMKKAGTGSSAASPTRSA